MHIIMMCFAVPIFLNQNPGPENSEFTQRAVLSQQHSLKYVYLSDLQISKTRKDPPWLSNRK